MQVFFKGGTLKRIGWVLDTAHETFKLYYSLMLILITAVAFPYW